MQWYHDKCLCLCHLKIVTQFTHLLSSVKSHIFYPDLLRPPWGCLGPPLFHRHPSPPRMFSDFLLRKGPLWMVGFLPLFPQGTLLIGHHNLDAP